MSLHLPLPVLMSEIGSSVDSVTPSYASRENIHESGNYIDEASFESDIGNITTPHLIPPRDTKILKSIHPQTSNVQRCRGLTGTFDGHR